ncbi:unnamed protein product, partial [Rotaria sp. Silwood2]
MVQVLNAYINKLVRIVTSDGRIIIGTLHGFDQAINIILDDSHERVFSSTNGVGQILLGLYIVRGDSAALIDEIDEELDNNIDFSEFVLFPTMYCLSRVLWRPYSWSMLKCRLSSVSIACHLLSIRSHSSLSKPPIQFSFVPPKLPVELEQYGHLLVEYVSSMCMAFNIQAMTYITTLESYHRMDNLEMQREFLTIDADRQRQITYLTSELLKATHRFNLRGAIEFIRERIKSRS